MDDDMMEQDYEPQANNQEGGYESMDQGGGRNTKLDLLFIQDATGSMGSYIASATKNIEEICASIVSSERLTRPDDLRVSVVSYRDHPPQDHSYITKTFPFTSSIPAVQEHLATLYASGGGDGPEAVTAAMAVAVEGVEWRPDAAKMVVLIADAPMHGIGEYGDGFREGSPDGKDPLELARQMASQGITMFIVACEPALSGYLYGTDIFKALCLITSGLMLPLTNASLLAHAIVGSALEHLDMERLIREVGDAVGERLRLGEQSVDDVARELHEKLMLRNESTKKIQVENIYKDSEESRHNVEVFSTAPNLAAAREHLRKVPGSRFTDKYLASRYTSSSSHYKPPVPSRPVGTVTAESSPTVTIGGPSSASSSSTAATPSSPPSRQVLTSFKAFGASTSTGVFGAPVLGSTSSAGAFRGGGGLRGGAGGDSDDEDDGGQRIGFEEGAISFDQAKRIAVGAAWRSRG
ncbi:hypothetical protein BDY24DRAFT_373778 [Mrakia frigida]|uniref:vWA domain-containing protein n=1 Tax=Mrakia frigida TaxID=29902 RepID=UPI003FCC2729